MSDLEVNGVMDDSAVLRAELARLRDELAAARDVDVVTDNLAMQQELDTLRLALREKSRVIEVTAAQCRSLEDELEDHHLAYDGLKQDLDRKKLSLAAAREQGARLSQEHHEIDQRYRALLASLSASAAPEAGRSGDAGPPGGAPRTAVTGLVIGGVVAGLALIAAVVLWRWFGLAPSGPAPQPTAEVAVPSGAGAPQAGSAEVTAAGPEPEPQRPEAREAPNQPVVLRTLRDRLADGSSGPPMLVLQGGDFTMGKAGALPNDDAAPEREVRVDGFLLGATEVTFAEYDRFARATAGRLPSDFGWGRGRRPVVDVNWSDAQAYAKWLSRQTGRRYRLPSEAEWEYAASAGRRSSFWWGYRPEPGRAVCFDCGTQWDNRSTAPAGSFAPNPLGLYDTAGNALEWVEDCYHPNYLGALSDGQPWADNRCRFRVARGGAFNKPASSMRSTARHRFAPDTRLNMLGFRLARDG